MSGREPDFDKDLREGEAREDAFVHVLLRSQVEHKRDRKALETGNVAIEYRQRCRDGEERRSGVAITKAERYAIEYAPECWLLIPTEKLKVFARLARATGRSRWIGDGNNHLNALVPLLWLLGEEPGPDDWPREPKQDPPHPEKGTPE
jgi:hypothetical protein